MRTIIVEDEKAAQELLKNMIQQNFPEYQLVAICDNVKSAIENIDLLKPEIIFMDIQIKGGTGFDVLEKITPYGYHLIFTTAFDQYAIQAIKNNAADYLLKPLIKSEFISAIEKIMNKAKTLSEESEPVLQVASKEFTSLVPIKKIYYLEADGSYTHIFYENKKITSSKNIGEYEEILKTYSFIRCHHSYLVNSFFILQIGKGRGGEIVLTNSTTIPISQRKIKLVKEYISNKNQ